jgi:peptidyl-prolyl cis-trans isomerase D
MFETLSYNLKHNRKNVMKRFTSYFIFGAILFVFVLWGLTPRQQGVAEGGAAAVVNTSQISIADYQDTMERLRRDPRFEQILSMGDAGRQILQQQAINQLIELEVAHQATEKQHIYTTDAEVRDFITAIPQFQEQGHFNRQAYLGYLDAVHKTPGEFEEEIRRQQALKRTVDMFRSALQPVPQQVEHQKALADMKANLEVASIPGDTLIAASAIPAGDVQKFLAQPDSEQKIKDYYQAHKTDFASDEKVKARHILVKFTAGDEASEKAAHEKIEKVAARLKKEDFAKVAKEVSDDPGSKAKGGDLGWFSKGRMVPEFETAVFSLKPGETSQPVKTQYGYHIIQVEEKKAAQSRTADDAKNEIAGLILAKQESQKALTALEETLRKGDLAGAEAFVKAHGLKWEETGVFSIESGSVPKVGANDDLVKAAFTVTAEKPLVTNLIHEGPTAFIARYKAVPAAKAKDEKPSDSNVMDEFLANQSAEDAIHGWLDGMEKGYEKDGKIVRNKQIFR